MSAPTRRVLMAALFSAIATAIVVVLVFNLTRGEKKVTPRIGHLYSIRDAQGKLMLADATPEEFQRVDPVLFNQIQHYIAVQADTSGAIEASGDIRAAPVPFSDSRRE